MKKIALSFILLGLISNAQADDRLPIAEPCYSAGIPVPLGTLINSEDSVLVCAQLEGRSVFLHIDEKKSIKINKKDALVIIH